MINEQVSRLNFTGRSVAYAWASFTPRDNDNDLSIDKLDNGQWIGVIDGNLELAASMLVVAENAMVLLGQIADPTNNNQQPNSNP